ncbi:MAG: trypsin-like peptidase domain-containing protein [Micropruina sp.]|nr:trypsin-like peptidase domain-containing protein [Micropruina sp.]
MARAEGGLRWLIVLTLTGLALAGIALLFQLNRPAAVAPPLAAAAPPTVLPTGRADQPSTGVVTVLAQLPGGRSTGTGIVVAEAGLVVTAYHVVQGSTSISVGTPVGGGSYSATLLGFDETHDVALLQLDGSPELALVRAAVAAVQPGDPVRILGSTAEGALRTLNGQVSAIDADLDAAVRTPGT